MNPVLKRIITALSVAVVLVCAILFVPAKFFAPVLVVLAALAIAEYEMLVHLKLESAARAEAHPCEKWLLTVVLTFIGVFVICGAMLELYDIAKMGNVILLYVLAIIKISDMGGFAFGMSSNKLMKNGNHKLCPSISPGKSWEGLGGSVLASVIVSCAFMGITKMSWGAAVGAGVTAALVGTFGDLVESKFKRWVGVKDSSTFKFTNGMGGILDMLDSLIFAPTVIAWLFL